MKKHQHGPDEGGQYSKGADAENEVEDGHTSESESGYESGSESESVSETESEGTTSTRSSPTLSQAERRELVNTVKREVLMELQPQRHAEESGEPESEMHEEHSDPDRRRIERLRAQVLRELQSELHGHRYRYGRPIGVTAASPIVDRAGLERARLDGAGLDGAGLHRRASAEVAHRNAFAELEPRRSSSTADKPMVGMPIAGISHRLRVAGDDMRRRVSKVNDRGQRTGFLCGVAAAALALMLFPSLRNGLNSAAATVASRASRMSGKLSSTMSRAKENMEDAIAEARYRIQRGPEMNPQ